MDSESIHLGSNPSPAAIKISTLLQCADFDFCLGFEQEGGRESTLLSRAGEQGEAR